MISDIGTIPNGQIVVLGINEEGSKNLTPVAYTALQTLGLNPDFELGFRDGLALLGRKNSGIGKQILTKSAASGRANLVSCLHCSSLCSQCHEDINEMTLI